MIWWIITLIIVALVLLPIYSKVGTSYPFYFQNIMIIIIAITSIRYIFFLKHVWIASSMWIKAVFIFIPIPIFFFLTGAFYDFQAFSDEQGITSALPGLHHNEQLPLAKYIRTETVLFWSAACLGNLLFPFRMLISIWRELNKGTH